MAVTIPETTAGRGGGMVESSIKSHFQKEAKCTTFLVKMSFICTRMKNHFHIKGWALNLVLIWKPGGTRTWPIVIILNSTLYLVRHAVASPCEHNFYRVASLCYAVTCPSPTRVYGPLIGSLSNSVFERRTSTGSGLFASLGNGLVETLR